MEFTRDDDARAGSEELLQWSVTRSSGSVVVVLTGDVDMSTAAGLGRLLERLVEDGPPFLTVDVSAVSFLDSSGIKCLLQGAAQAAAAGGTLVVRHPTSAIERIFAICGVEDLLLGDPLRSRAADGR